MATAEATELLTIDETADLLRLSRSQIYALAQDGRLPAIRIGRSVRVPRRRLLEWLDGQALTAAGRP